MKRLFAIVLCLILITSFFSGCSNVGNSSGEVLSSELPASTGDGGGKISEPEQTVSDNATDTSSDTAPSDENTSTEETSTPVETEEKKYSTATIDQDFADNEIIVYFPKTTDIEKWKREYTVEDFPEIECIAVNNYEYIRELVLGENKTKSNKYMTTHRRYVTITLKERSKENVLSAINLLEKREDIYYVAPQYYARLD
ncbi:MAG: hypothetical protein IKD04_05670 [Clostridia bacterium]|nr:hypothetical protein [Clostridia bacterium]